MRVRGIYIALVLTLFLSSFSGTAVAQSEQPVVPPVDVTNLLFLPDVMKSIFTEPSITHPVPAVVQVKNTQEDSTASDFCPHILDPAAVQAAGGQICLTEGQYLSLYAKGSAVTGAGWNNDQAIEVAGPTNANVLPIDHRPVFLPGGKDPNKYQFGDNQDYIVFQVTITTSQVSAASTSQIDPGVDLYWRVMQIPANIAAQFAVDIPIDYPVYNLAGSVTTLAEMCGDKLEGRSTWKWIPAGVAGGEMAYFAGIWGPNSTPDPDTGRYDQVFTCMEKGDFRYFKWFQVTMEPEFVVFRYMVLNDPSLGGIHNYEVPVPDWSTGPSEDIWKVGMISTVGGALVIAATRVAEAAVGGVTTTIFLFVPKDKLECFVLGPYCRPVTNSLQVSSQ